MQPFGLRSGCVSSPSILSILPVISCSFLLLLILLLFYCGESFDGMNENERNRNMNWKVDMKKMSAIVIAWLAVGSLLACSDGEEMGTVPPPAGGDPDNETVQPLIKPLTERVDIQREYALPEQIIDGR
ncbi:hypothetical protein EVA_05379 [gut metagenome]|uniref:Uncharacterized protein n=1 Tax=gut metagenome TaxID=749906 RepID=J9D1Q5_9ZZZZ